MISGEKSMRQDQSIFDKVSKEYRTLHSNNIKISGESSEYFAEYKILELKNRFNLVKPLKILDLGCGDGISGYYFNKYFKDIEYYGVDVSKESLKIAQARKISTCTFKYYDGAHIPSNDSFFDLVFISCVLHHVDYSTHINLLKECRRVLKYAGKIVIFEHNPLNPLTRKIVNNCVFDKDAVLIPHRRLIEILKISGFKVIKSIFTIFMPRKKIFKFFLFVEKYLFWFPLGGQYYIVAEKK